MAQDKTLMTITYERIATSEEVTLTIDNCANYGYSYKTITDEGTQQQIIAFYKSDDKDQTIESYDEIVNGVAKTIIIYNTYQKYTHIAPPCSTYKISYADVDKEGSGRNSLTGEMFRERIGSYCMIDLTWDLIPNTIEYNNWYKVLTHLPPSFYVEFLSPNGEHITKEFYRSDISTSLYLFVKDKQIWQGLSTSFTQWSLDEYDDTYEPTLGEIL